jgi:hypothetical protein
MDPGGGSAVTSFSSPQVVEQLGLVVHSIGYSGRELPISDPSRWFPDDSFNGNPVLSENINSVGHFTNSSAVFANSFGIPISTTGAKPLNTAYERFAGFA